jgi:uncharacterized protein YukE
MVDIHVDPDKLEEFASKLNSKTREMQIILEGLYVSYRRLAGIWKDQEFLKFESEFQKILKHLREFINEVEQVVPKLRKDIQYIREYLSR